MSPRSSRRPVLLASVLLFLIVIGGAAGIRPALGYSPKAGDAFNYSETITVNNGQGSYLGYTDQTHVTGMEQMNSVAGGVVSATYGYSSQFSNSQGGSNSNSSSGKYSWSTSSFTYVNGTDNQAGYSKPVYVWFAMNPSLGVGSTFYSLNTQLTVLSKNYSFQLPTEGNKYVQAIQAKGTGQYQRDDSYGTFGATYTWYEYFDPATGYIVGYTYLEQDSGQYQGQQGSFTYNDTLFVTSTSYPLAPANPPSQGPSGLLAGLVGLLPYIAGLAIVLVIIVIVALALRRRNRKDNLPRHSYTPQPPPPSPPQQPWESKVDLGSKPTEEVVIREVAKVNCKYCGTLIPTTAETCPYCGAPRQ